MSVSLAAELGSGDHRAECAAAGAEPYLVDGLIGDAGKLVAAAVARRRGYQDTSTLREPYRIEGKKTMGFGDRRAARLVAARRDRLPHLSSAAGSGAGACTDLGWCHCGIVCHVRQQ